MTPFEHWVLYFAASHVFHFAYTQQKATHMKLLYATADIAALVMASIWWFRWVF